MHGQRMLVLSVALVLAAAELGQLLGVAAQIDTADLDDATLAVPASDAHVKAKRPTKLKRTIRVKETQPPAVVPAPVVEPAKSATLLNVGPTNKVDIQPNISIAPQAALPPATQNQPVPAVSAQPVRQIVQPVERPQQQLQPVLRQLDGPEVVDATTGSNNKLVSGVQNSNNQLMDLTDNSNNRRATVVRNSGNTEHVHIDGVGNQKHTHISNAGNVEHEHRHLPPAAALQPPVAPQVQSLDRTNLQQPALIQINMNEPAVMGQPLRQPLLMMPAFGNVPAQQMAPPFPLAGSLQLVQQSAALPPSMMVAAPQTPLPLGAPLMGGPVAQLAQPMMMTPTFQPPIMMDPRSALYPPMLAPPPPFYPAAMWPARGGPSSGTKLARDAKRTKRTMRKLKRGLKKLERRQRRHHQKANLNESDKPAAAAATVAPAKQEEDRPAVVAQRPPPGVDGREQPARNDPVEQPSEPRRPPSAPATVLAPAQSVESEPEVGAETDAAPDTPNEEEGDNEAGEANDNDDDDDEEEVIEWDTIRVPRRRKAKRAKLAPQAPLVQEGAGLASSLMSTAGSSALKMLRPITSFAGGRDATVKPGAATVKQ